MPLHEDKVIRRSKKWNGCLTAYLHMGTSNIGRTNGTINRVAHLLNCAQIVTMLMSLVLKMEVVPGKFPNTVNPMFRLRQNVHRNYGLDPHRNRYENTACASYATSDSIERKKRKYLMVRCSMFVQHRCLTLLWVYTKPSTLNTGIITQSYFCAKSTIAGSFDVSNSFKKYVAVAAVTHSRA